MRILGKSVEYRSKKRSVRESPNCKKNRRTEGTQVDLSTEQK